jgi:GntR family transcriptional regulator of vanillate catabolism
VTLPDVSTSEAHDSGEPQSQTEKAVMGIRDLLVAGRLQEGERVRELHVAELLRVSRTPVRAALQRLCEEGLLEALPSGGYAARRFSHREIAVAIEIRGALEGINARLVAEQGASPEVLARLGRIADAIDGVLGPLSTGPIDFGAYIELNAAFHDTLLAAGNSRLLAQDVARASARPFAAASALVQAHASLAEAKLHLLVAQDQHRAIIDALAAREGARAEALLREHARLSYRNLTRALNARATLSEVPGSPLLREAADPDCQ